MKTNIRSSFFLLGCLFLLGGCSTLPQAGQAPPSFGNAVRQNIAVQTVHPEAVENYKAQSYNGERSALAQKRYVTDTAEKPVAPKTSSGGGQ